MTISVNSAMVCDDIRTEDNGKIIAIGIYRSEIQLQRLPATMRLKILVGINIKDTGDFKVEFRVIVGGEVGHNIVGNLNANTLGQDWLVVPIEQITIQEPCELKISSRIGDGRWKSLCSTRVGLLPSASGS